MVEMNWLDLTSGMLLARLPWLIVYSVALIFVLVSRHSKKLKLMVGGSLAASLIVVIADAVVHPPITKFAAERIIYDQSSLPSYSEADRRYVYRVVEFATSFLFAVPELIAFAIICYAAFYDRLLPQRRSGNATLKTQSSQLV